MPVPALVFFLIRSQPWTKCDGQPKKSDGPYQPLPASYFIDVFGKQDLLNLRLCSQYCNKASKPIWREIFQTVEIEYKVRARMAMQNEYYTSHEVGQKYCMEVEKDLMALESVKTFVETMKVKISISDSTTPFRIAPASQHKSTNWEDNYTYENQLTRAINFTPYLSTVHIILPSLPSELGISYYSIIGPTCSALLSIRQSLESTSNSKLINITFSNLVMDQVFVLRWGAFASYVGPAGNTFSTWLAKRFWSQIESLTVTMSPFWHDHDHAAAVIILHDETRQHKREKDKFRTGVKALHDWLVGFAPKLHHLSFEWARIDECHYVNPMLLDTPINLPINPAGRRSVWFSAPSITWPCLETLHLDGMDVDDADFEMIRGRAPVLRFMTIGDEAVWKEAKKEAVVVEVEEKEEEHPLPEQEEEPTLLLLNPIADPITNPIDIDAYFSHRDAEQAKKQRESEGGFVFSAVEEETTRFKALDGLFELQGDEVFGGGSGEEGDGE